MEIPQSLKIEDNFENLAVNALSKVNLSGVNARFAEEITDANIQVVFETEGNLDEGVILIENYRKYNAYEGTLGFIVSTHRAKIKNHSDKLASVRYIMMKWISNECILSDIGNMVVPQTWMQK